MEEERKETRTDREEIAADKESTIVPNGDAPNSSMNAFEGKVATKHSRFNKKHMTRLIVSAIASAITLLFFGLSYYFFKATISAVIFVAAITVIGLAFVAIYKDWETVYKLSVTAIYIAAVFLVGYYILAEIGFFEKIHSADDFVHYVNNSGGVAEVIFVAANFLQVTIVPIPSAITTTAGAILFDGIWKPLYLTVIGLVAGSMLAFFLGRVFGVRFANWLVGEKMINKYKQMVKGRDKIVLFYMFIFPFFPDDFLCILAGMTNYTYLGFFLLQIFTRTVGVLTTILLTKGIISIPLEGLWLLLWGVIIVVVIVLLVLTIKYSDRIESAIMKIIDKLPFGLSGKIKKKREEEVSESETLAPAADTPSLRGEDSPSTTQTQGEEKRDYE